MRVALSVAAGMFVLSVVSASLASAQKQKATTIQVTATIYDENSAPNDLLLRSDDYNGNGLWQATYDNSGGVTSRIFSSNGSWQLYLGNQSVRRIWLTLSRPANNSGPAPVPDGYYSDSVEVYSRCWDTNNQETGLLVIPPGMANTRCTLGVDFAYARTKYKLVMGPTISGTGWATVSCNAGSGATCDNWTITPNSVAGSGNVPTVAALYKFAKNGSLVFLGWYYNTYRIDVTNP